jgi:hypothetical protein
LSLLLKKKLAALNVIVPFPYIESLLENDTLWKKTGISILEERATK